jgi:hypothetical protein
MTEKAWALSGNLKRMLTGDGQASDLRDDRLDDLVAEAAALMAERREAAGDLAGAAAWRQVADDPGGQADYPPAHAAAAHATHGLTAHATVAHTPTSSITAGIQINAATVGGVAFSTLFRKEMATRADKLKRPLSPTEMREVRDQSYEKLKNAMGRAFTSSEEAELKLIYAKLGI